jgi:hypothetical protein
MQHRLSACSSPSPSELWLPRLCGIVQSPHYTTLVHSLAWLDGREVIAVYEDPQAAKPSNLMWLAWTADRISFIRDYRHVRHVIDDLSADTGATRCFWHVHGAAARAVANIRQWMMYLPEDCVRTMVHDGWHWSA